MTPRRVAGVAAVEFALVLPVLIVLALALMELGRAVLTRQIMLNVSREAANLASRGTALDIAIAAVQASATPLDLATDGYVIVTEVQRNPAGLLVVYQQRASGGVTAVSRIGRVGGPATLPPTLTPLPPLGHTLFAAEVFFRSEPVTPLAAVIGITPDETLYDVAYF